MSVHTIFIECRDSCFCTELVVGLYFNKYFTSYYWHRVVARACADICSAHMPEYVHTWTHAEIHLHVCTYESINKFVDVANCTCYASTFQVQSHMYTLVQP